MDSAVAEAKTADRDQSICPELRMATGTFRTQHRDNAGHDATQCRQHVKADPRQEDWISRGYVDAQDDSCFLKHAWPFSSATTTGVRPGRDGLPVPFVHVRSKRWREKRRYASSRAATAVTGQHRRSKLTVVAFSTGVH